MSVMVLDRSNWASDPSAWKGRFEGTSLGTGVTVLFYATEEVGVGPTLHVHPYDEVFIVREGRARFTVGGEGVEVEAGQIVLDPANVPHKYHNLGPGRLETTDVHVSPTWIQTDLDDPDATSEASRS